MDLRFHASKCCCLQWPRGGTRTGTVVVHISMGQRRALMLKGVVDRLVEIELILQISKSMYYIGYQVFIVVPVCQDVETM